MDDKMPIKPAPAGIARLIERVAPIVTIVVLLLLVPPIAYALDDPFLIKVFTRVAVFAIAAVALNVILGFGDLISLLQAGLLGIGGYVVAILAHHDFDGAPLIAWPLVISGTSNLAISMPLGILASAIVALLTGLVSLRTIGAYFIMITLAFNQMLYYFFVALQQYGGEDGLQILGNLHFAGFDITRRVTFYYLCVGVLALVLVFSYRLIDSRLGIVIRALSQNERRMLALGIPPLRYKLVAFVISGALAGVAGTLLAASQQFVSPADMSWVRSADLVVMAVLGGLSTVWGPVLGAGVFLILELTLSTLTVHWQLIFGLLIIIMIMYLHGGLADLWSLLVGKRGAMSRHE
jgi:branched-chain amino acid transport system permease protein